MKVRAKCEGQESHFMLPGVWENVKEWTFTPPNERPFWELEFQWIFKFLESDCSGQNPLYWRVHYTIENILERKCLKWARMTHLDISSTSYGQKKGQEPKWQLDFRPLKVWNRPDFLACRWRVICYWKALNKSYNFAWDLISIRGLHAKLWAPKL